MPIVLIIRRSVVESTFFDVLANNDGKGKEKITPLPDLTTSPILYRIMALIKYGNDSLLKNNVVLLMQNFEVKQK